MHLLFQYCMIKLKHFSLLIKVSPIVTYVSQHNLEKDVKICFTFNEMWEY